MFATRDIKFGKLVFAKRPLLVVPANCNFFGLASPAHYTLEQQKSDMMEYERKPEIIVGVMSEKNKKGFKELINPIQRMTADAYSG